MEKMTPEVQTEQRTFRQIYADLGTTPPKKAFVERIMEVVDKSKSAVNGWVYGAYVPDTLTQKAIEKELGIPREVLFPKTEEAE
jgi:hypothetical protein